MRVAGAQLSALIAHAVDPSRYIDADRRRLRHELRTPLNAIKGYRELLVEEMREGGRDALLQDLGKVLDLADRLLVEIDRMVEFAGTQGSSVAATPTEIVSTVLQTIKPLGGADTADLNAGSSRMLVVDDNASNRDLLSRRLLREGYQVTTTEDGASALALIAAESFDLVLLDLMMPGMSGFEVLCRLKADERSRHIPVIKISALDELDSTVRCIEAGAEDYLAKIKAPINAQYGELDTRITGGWHAFDTALGPDRGSQVRNRLPAGGRGIRTLGPSAKESVSLSERRSAGEVQ
jgi:adenylate cyclase